MKIVYMQDAPLILQLRKKIQKCIDLVKSGQLKLRFKAIFIDEVQIFDPQYLELCYLLLEDAEDKVLL